MLRVDAACPECREAILRTVTQAWGGPFRKPHWLAVGFRHTALAWTLMAIVSLVALAPTPAVLLFLPLHLLVLAAAVQVGRNASAADFPRVSGKGTALSIIARAALIAELGFCCPGCLFLDAVHGGDMMDLAAIATLTIAIGLTATLSSIGLTAAIARAVRADLPPAKSGPLFAFGLWFHAPFWLGLAIGLGPLFDLINPRGPFAQPFLFILPAAAYGVIGFARLERALRPTEEDWKGLVADAPAPTPPSSSGALAPARAGG